MALIGAIFPIPFREAEREAFFYIYLFIFFIYIHTWHSLTIQLHILKYKYGTYLQQDYKIYLRYSLLLTYLLLTYIKIPKTSLQQTK